MGTGEIIVVTSKNVTWKNVVKCCWAMYCISCRYISCTTSIYGELVDVLIYYYAAYD